MSEGRLETAIRVIRQGINLQVELNKNKLTDAQRLNIKDRLSERITTLDKEKDVIVMKEEASAPPKPKVESKMKEPMPEIKDGKTTEQKKVEAAPLKKPVLSKQVEQPKGEMEDYINFDKILTETFQQLFGTTLDEDLKKDIKSLSLIMTDMQLLIVQDERKNKAKIEELK